MSVFRVPQRIQVLLRSGDEQRFKLFFDEDMLLESPLFCNFDMYFRGDFQNSAKFNSCEFRGLIGLMYQERGKMYAGGFFLGKSQSEEGLHRGFHVCENGRFNSNILVLDGKLLDITNYPLNQYCREEDDGLKCLYEYCKTLRTNHIPHEADLRFKVV
ncbi:MAG: hypothetical protein ACLFPL_03715 [Candidatus Nanoarchaeia archaeon]